MLKEAASGGEVNSRYTDGDMVVSELSVQAEWKCATWIPIVHSCTVHISGGILSQGIMGPPPFP